MGGLQHAYGGSGAQRLLDGGHHPGNLPAVLEGAIDRAVLPDCLGELAPFGRVGRLEVATFPQPAESPGEVRDGAHLAAQMTADSTWVLVAIERLEAVEAVDRCPQPPIEAEDRELVR